MLPSTLPLDSSFETLPTVISRRLSNALTGAFKDLDPIPQFKAAARLASFLKAATTGTIAAQAVPLAS